MKRLYRGLKCILALQALMVWTGLSISVLTPSPLPAQNTDTIQKEKIHLKNIEFEGTILVNKSELQTVVSPYLKQVYSLSEFNVVIKEIQVKLNKFYQDKGLVRTLILLKPDQSLSNTLTFTVINNNRIDEIEIIGLQRIREGYVKKRIRAIAREPVKVDDIELALSKLQEDPLFAVVQGNLTESDEGGYLLTINIAEDKAFSVRAEFNNAQNPAVGSEQLVFTASSLNLSGLADNAIFQWQHTKGSDQVLGAYSFPVNGLGGQLRFTYQLGNSKIVQPPLAQFDVEQDFTQVTGAFIQPLYIGKNNEVGIFVGLDWQQILSSVENQPFPLTPEINNPRVTTTALSLGNFWNYRSQKDSLFLSNELRFGVGLLNATIEDTPSGIDSRYFLWRVQSQYARQISPNWLFIANISGQLTPDTLLNRDQFKLGGDGTVLGYEYNTLAGDNGVSGSLTVSHTLWNGRKLDGNLNIYSFVAAGTVWNNFFPNNPNNTLFSTGIGLRGGIKGFYWDLNGAVPLSNNENTQSFNFGIGFQRKF